MHTRFILGVIAGVGLLTLALEATGAESPGSDFQPYRGVLEPLLPRVK
jgi:hypothetical protein